MARLLFVLLTLTLWATARLSWADVLEAPVGGAPIDVGPDRVACPQRPPGGWIVEDAGRKLRPPAAAAAVGSVAELATARAPQDCAHASLVRLVVTAAWPAIDPSGFTLHLDEGRLVGRGKSLAGVIVSWPEGTTLASDVCHNHPKSGPGPEVCAWAVAKTVSADPSAGVLRWWPAGAVPALDAVVFRSDGKRAASETFVLAPSAVEILDLLPDATVDVSSGSGRASVSHPEAVASIDCAPARCALESGLLVVQAPPASVTALDVKLRLLPRIVYTRKNPPESQPDIRVAVLRCPMTVASGPPLRGIDGSRVVVRVEGVCARDVAALGFMVGSQRVDVDQTLRTNDAGYALLEIGIARGPELAIAAVRGDDGLVVAMARSETRPAPVVRTTLEIPGFPPVDFIPNNRGAIVHSPHMTGAELVLLSVPDVYEATTEQGVTTVRGDVQAVGLTSLQFGYRVATLPHPLDSENLAILTDALQRGVKEANIPAPFGLSAMGPEPLAEVLCGDDRGADHRLVPGGSLHLPFEARYGCRLILHRDRLPAEDGTQKLTLEIEVDKVDGSSRPEAHTTQTLVLQHGGEPRIAWIRGVVAPYDRIIVRLSHIADEAHYLGALDIVTGEPIVQWTCVFGTGRLRLYATTAIPTGLYRFGTKATSGVLSLSLGVISRFTWLDSDGKEGILGLEAGLMAFGVTGSDTSSSGAALEQAGAVAGLGMSIPIANAGGLAQASINLHAWFEQRIAGSGPEASSRQAVIFGPSISLGNVGTTF
jgi:hypothetical protein